MAIIQSLRSHLVDIIFDNAKLAPVPHIAREFIQYPDAAYMLPSDQKEAERLKLQHRVLKEAYEGRTLLCPFNPRTPYFVLDSGSGCGSWVIDTASQLSPSSILHGTDISGRIFPMARPLNASFLLYSILALPDEWAGRFDIVHQRQLMAALRRLEWPVALAQIYRVLRPGGWVQLGEYGSWHAGPITEQHAIIHRAVYKARGLNRDIATDLPGLLAAAGFTNVRAEKREIPIGAWGGKHGEESRRNMMAAYHALKSAVLQDGGLGYVKSEEELDKLLDAVEKEFNETEGAGVDFHIICAQRPTKPNASITGVY